MKKTVNLTYIRKLSTLRLVKALIIINDSDADLRAAILAELNERGFNPIRPVEKQAD